MEKELELETLIGFRTCSFCGCLVLKPCKTWGDSLNCINNQIDMKFQSDDFDPQQN